MLVGHSLVSVLVVAVRAGVLPLEAVPCQVSFKVIFGDLLPTPFRTEVLQKLTVPLAWVSVAA